MILYPFLCIYIYICMYTIICMGVQKRKVKGPAAPASARPWGELASGPQLWYTAEMAGWIKSHGIQILLVVEPYPSEKYESQLG